jgi:hypothetical protein
VHVKLQHVVCAMLSTVVQLCLKTCFFQRVHFVTYSRTAHSRQYDCME